MTITEVVLKRLQAMPHSTQQEVLNFIESLESRHQNFGKESEDFAWSEFSLSSAMHGIEDEETLYSLTDLKEVFS